MSRWGELLSEWPEMNNSTDDGGGGGGGDATETTFGPLSTDPPSIVLSNSLTDEQEILLSSLQVASALLSLTGSCVIVYKILRCLYKSQSTTPYDRIILGLSTCDIVASAVLAASVFLLPSETSPRIWAFGSEQSCEFMGFLMQISAFWAVWYNCILSFYYLLTVRFRVKREELHKKYELWMHLSGAIFFPLTAIVGLFGNFYGEQALTISCWVRSVGDGLGNETEIAGYIFGTPIMITFISIVVNNIIIYRHVRKTLLSSKSSSSGPPTAADIENNASDSGGGSSASDSGGSRSSDGGKSIKEKLAREAAIQGFLYVSCFLLTCSPVFILQVLDGSLGYDIDDKAQIYPLLVLNSLLVPLQGFFNVFIYVRPSYSRFATANPDKPVLAVLKLALLESNIPRMTSFAASSSNNNNHTNKPTSSGGILGDKNSPFAIAIDRKHSEMKSRGGSNFEASLKNIVEEDSDPES